jgi:hypothetical protein
VESALCGHIVSRREIKTLDEIHWMPILLKFIKDSGETRRMDPEQFDS